MIGFQIFEAKTSALIDQPKDEDEIGNRPERAHRGKRGGVKHKKGSRKPDDQKPGDPNAQPESKNKVEEANDKANEMAQDYNESGIGHNNHNQQPNDPTSIYQLEIEIEGLDLQLLDDNYTDSEYSEAESIWSAKGSGAASISTAPAIEEASAELVSLLVEHPNLKDLYGPAITLHGPVEFRIALCAIFKTYAKALKAGAKKPQELKAGDLVRGCARRAAHACVAFHDPSVPLPDVAFRWGALHRQKLQAETKVEDYLNNLEKDAGSNDDRKFGPPKAPLPNDDPKNGLVDMSDESDKDDIGDSLPNLSKVVAYMTSGTPFEQLQRDILDLSTRRVEIETKPLNLEKTAKTEQLNGKTDIPIDRLNYHLNEQVPKSNLNLAWLLLFCRRRFRWWLAIGGRPKLTLGCTRLSWKCVSNAASRLVLSFSLTNF